MMYDIIIIEREVVSMKEKTFDYKGQMINYYKVKANPKVTWCTMSTDAIKGYTVRWSY